MDFSKLDVEILPSKFFEVLNELIKRLEFISVSSLDDDAFKKKNKVFCDEIIDLETMQICSEIQGFINKRKLIRFFMKIINNLNSINVELLENGSFNCLLNEVDEIASLYLNRHFTITKFEAIMQHYKELKENAFDFEKEFIEKKNLVYNEWVQTYLNFFENEQNLQINKSFNYKMLASRENQVNLKAEKDESKVLKNIKEIEDLMENEKVVTKKVIDFYSLKTKELRNEAQRMSILYDKELEEKELKLQIVKNNRKHYFEMIKQEEEKFAQRQNAIDSYLAEKQRKAEEKKLREMQEEASTLLQAWWRGLMVRLYKGPFKIYKKRARQIRREMRMAKIAEKNKKRKK
ncbi:hypothetical protein PVAND_005950 [Polypedilum vanderplanki]|uniref:Uncharacterized protein n=1 Tax=Polypedilum vanderplanki TaxID=319348 RepID=A0A9J6C2I9_POLVA|nr:hypothetical protein PVAND_005950 [Polypedilum vanderplanki]